VPTEPEFLALQVQVNALDRLLTAQLKAQDDKVQLALQAAEKAITKAEIATEKRFEGVNEFRQTLSDQARDFANKSETEIVLGGFRDKLDTLSRAVSQLLISLLVTIVGILITALIFAVTR
jgi:hypothetical protein